MERTAFFFLRQIARTFPTIKFPSEAVHDEQERIVFCVWCLFMLPNKTRNDDKSTRNNARYFDFRLYLFNCNSQQSKLNIQLLLLNRNCNWSIPPPSLAANASSFSNIALYRQLWTDRFSFHSVVCRWTQLSYNIHPHIHVDASPSSICA